MVGGETLIYFYNKLAPTNGTLSLIGSGMICEDVVSWVLATIAGVPSQKQIINNRVGGRLIGG